MHGQGSTSWLGGEALRANLARLDELAAERTLTVQRSPLGRHTVSIDGEQLAEAGDREAVVLAAVRAAEARCS